MELAPAILMAGSLAVRHDVGSVPPVSVCTVGVILIKSELGMMWHTPTGQRAGWKVAFSENYFL